VTIEPAEGHANAAGGAAAESAGAGPNAEGGVEGVGGQQPSQAGAPEASGGYGADAGNGAGNDDGGCACRMQPAPHAFWNLAALGLLVTGLARRARSRAMLRACPSR
jgi:hypothetical protein